MRVDNVHELKRSFEETFGGTFHAAGKNPTYLFQSALKKEKTVNENPCLIAALKYLQLGLSIIPMYAVIEGNEIHKKSYVKWKPFQSARPTEGQVREWWATWPNAMIGVICGKVSNIISIDVDTPEEDAIVQGMIPEGLAVPCCTTPRGGKHYLFRYRPGVKTSDNGQFEDKSDGAIVILPPSRISDNRAYQWI